MSLFGIKASINVIGLVLKENPDALVNIAKGSAAVAEVIDSDELYRNSIYNSYKSSFSINGLYYLHVNNTLHSVIKDKDGISLPTHMSDGLKQWHWNGNLERRDRVNGRLLPSMVKEVNGDVQYWWHKDNKPHRVDLDENGFRLPASITFYNDGREVYKWYKDGKHTNESVDEYGTQQPATVIIIDGEIAKMEWVINNVHHREDRDEKGHLYPCIITRDASTWYKNGFVHRDDRDNEGLLLPAHISNYRYSWYKDGKIHNDDKVKGITKPALCIFDEIQHLIEWRIEGVSHRDDVDEYGRNLPQSINFKGNEFLWRKDGEYHNTSVDEYGNQLPAVVSFKDGDVEGAVWFINGKVHNSTVDPETGAPKYSEYNSDEGYWWYNNGKSCSYTDNEGKVLPAAIIAGDDRPYYQRMKGVFSDHIKSFENMDDYVFNF